MPVSRAMSDRWAPLLRGILGVAWCFVAFRVFQSAAPHLGHAGGPQSDNAIPQLMANAEHLTPYHLYYWGQDRFTGGPFILAWLFRQLTGHGWTGDELYWFMCVVLATSAWPLMRLGGGVLAPMLLLVLGLSPTAREHILNIGQPYGWQLPTLFWAWWSLRVIAEREASDAFGSRRFWRRVSWPHVIPAALLCFLAIWASTMSFVLLAIIAIIEARLLPASRTRRWRWSFLLLPVGLGLLGELVIKLTHALYAFRHDWWFQATMLDVDLKHLLQNIRMQSAVFAHDPWCWSLLVALVLCALLVRAGITGEGPGAAITLTMLAVANFGMTTLLSWTRLNQYNPRYLAVTYVFAVLGAAGALRALVSRTHFDRRAALVLSTSALLLAAVLVPRRAASEDAARIQRVTAELLHRAPGGVLLGSYWGTYLFVDGSAEKPLVPVVEESIFNRTPWNNGRLRQFEQVIVSHVENTRLGSAEHPPQYLSEWGALLELDTPHWFSEGPYVFSLYRNRLDLTVPGVRVHSGDAVLEQPCRLLPCLPLPPQRAESEAFRMELPALNTGRALIFFGVRHDDAKTLPKFRVEPFPPGAVLDATAEPPMLSVRFNSAVPVQTLRFVYQDSGADPLPAVRAVQVLR